MSRARFLFSRVSTAKLTFKHGILAPSRGEAAVNTRTGDFKNDIVTFPLACAEAPCGLANTRSISVSAVSSLDPHPSYPPEPSYLPSYLAAALAITLVVRDERYTS